jgi:hypothetical protein
MSPTETTDLAQSMRDADERFQEREAARVKPDTSERGMLVRLIREGADPERAVEVVGNAFGRAPREIRAYPWFTAAIREGSEPEPVPEPEPERAPEPEPDPAAEQKARANATAEAEKVQRRMAAQAAKVDAAGATYAEELASYADLAALEHDLLVAAGERRTDIRRDPASRFTASLLYHLQAADGQGLIHLSGFTGEQVRPLADE